MEIPNTYKKILFYVFTAFLAVLTVYFAAQAVFAIKYSGSSDKSVEHTITVSGHGEVDASPDIANISFTIMKDAKTVKDAQDQVAQIEKKALELLKADGVEEKDIKTSSASFSPKYEYVYSSLALPCGQYGCPPRPGKNVITGYEAYETISVKVRNIDSTGKIIQDLGGTGVSDLNGPNFAIDKEDAIKAEARSKAIADAQSKAKELAKELGVSLSGVANFSESGNNVYPVMYKSAAIGAGAMDSASPVPAQLPRGQNTVTSDVTITYDFK